ncbi:MULTISPECIES: right-handed parallel beta-helix repeat-containing protein [Bacillus cereus group]|uniref:right-handed parallel beta-helix repeat-containing protein n=1 Tax=Bacillus cereus group TaxID=86661 RepID=UPI0001A099B7|nr:MULTISPECIES: right-handed parallel beta-helix repeat-containing protein [Bacillus cereus group]EEL48439.1 YclG (Pectin lyase-like protein) [Bacillus cereus Rock3-44]PFO80448.1 hypothetical protein COJ77_18495 [Bacillus cereus]
MTESHKESQENTVPNSEIEEIKKCLMETKQKLQKVSIQLEDLYKNSNSHGYLIELSRWGIINDGSKETEKEINNALQWAYDNGINRCILSSGTYLINAVGPPNDLQAGGIKIPDNMTLDLWHDTVLKVKANDSYSYSCIYLYNKNNIKIRGGTIQGDRYHHDFSTAPTGKLTHEWGRGINIIGCSNITIDNMNIKECTGDAIDVLSIGLMNTQVYIPSSNITIRNCTLDKSRRNNLSLEGCDGVLVENNVITNAGIDDGTAPRFGIDIEGYGEGATDYVVPLNIVIKNNKFEGNVTTSICNFNGYNVIIEGNISDNTISYAYGTQTIISNNIFKRVDLTTKAISSIGTAQGLDFNNTTITGNIITGFDTALDIRGKNVTVSSNIIYDVKIGISLFQAESILVQGNLIKKATFGKAIIINTCTNIKCTENQLKDIGMLCIELNNSSAVTINQNDIFNSKQGIRISKSNAVLQGNSIDLNTFNSPSYNIDFDATSNVLIINNLLKNCSSFAINLSNGSASSKSRIIKNIIENFTAISAINLSGGRHELIDNILIANKNIAGGYGINLHSCNQSTVLRNHIFSSSIYNLSTPIKTNTSTNTKIIENVCIGGSLNINETDIVTNNILI